MKIGLGKNWNNLKLSYTGIGIRSYIDWKIKGSIYLSAGYEQNYRTAFNNIQQLRNYSAWQSSGLAGVAKRYSLGGKKLKGEMKLLWDFLSYRRGTQAILFRIGYAWH